MMTLHHALLAGLAPALILALAGARWFPAAGQAPAPRLAGLLLGVQAILIGIVVTASAAGAPAA